MVLFVRFPQKSHKKRTFSQIQGYYCFELVFPHLSCAAFLCVLSALFVGPLRMEVDNQPLHQIESHAIELTDIEFQHVATSNTKWFHHFPNQHSRFTATQNGRFVWRFMGEDRLMIVDLILGVTRSLAITTNTRDVEISTILCFTHVEDDWGLIIFTYDNQPHIAKARLDMNCDLLVIDYMNKVCLKNPTRVSCSMASVDWWPEKRVAIALVGSLTTRQSCYHAVHFAQDEKIVIKRLTNDFFDLTPESAPQILQQQDEEVMAYKMENPLMLAVFGDRKGCMSTWTERKWDSMKHAGFMKRFGCVRLSDSQTLFIQTSYVKKNGEELSVLQLLNYNIPRTELYSFFSFNAINGQFHEVQMSEQLLPTIREGRNRSMFLDKDGILTVLVEKASKKRGIKRFAVRRVPLRKPEQLVNLTAIACIKKGVKVDRFPLVYSSNVNPFEKEG